MEQQKTEILIAKPKDVYKSNVGNGITPFPPQTIFIIKGDYQVINLGRFVKSFQGESYGFYMEFSNMTMANSKLGKYCKNKRLYAVLLN